MSEWTSREGIHKETGACFQPTIIPAFQRASLLVTRAFQRATVWPCKPPWCGSRVLESTRYEQYGHTKEEARFSSPVTRASSARRVAGVSMQYAAACWKLALRAKSLLPHTPRAGKHAPSFADPFPLYAPLTWCDPSFLRPLLYLPFPFSRIFTLCGDKCTNGC